MRDPRRVNLRDFRVPVRLWTKYVLPDDVVRVDRRSPWGNTYRIGDPDPRPTAPAPRMDRARVLWLYRLWLYGRLAIDPLFLEDLRGKRLACWCGDDELGEPLPCHIDILLEELDRSAVP